MIPILYTSGTTDFTTNGLGGLPDIISGNVIEERNGMYELEMVYPIDGLHFNEISIDRIIKAKPNQTDEPQGFRIYNISKPIDGKVTINAEHISYQTQHIPIMPMYANTPSAFFSKVSTYACCDMPFSFSTNKTKAISFRTTTPKSLRACMLGSEGSILDLCGSGDYYYDNFNISFLEERGHNNGVKIAYGKNLKDVKQEENIEDVITAVCPYWQKDDSVVVLDEKIVTSADDTFAYTRAVPLDLSSEFEEKPTQAQLKAKAEEYLKTAQKTPKVNIEVDFVALGDTLDYPELKGLENVSLCDTVTVEFIKLGVNATAKVIKTDYDFVAEKYNKIEVGDSKSRFSETIVKSAGVDKQKTNSMIQKVVESQTSLITGAKNSYVVIDTDDNDGNGQRILFMDSPSTASAKQVLQINKNGIGFSQTGVNGPYTYAWTIDGVLNTEFLSASALNGISANIIGGSVNLTTSSEEDSLIELSYNEWKAELCPLQLVLTNSNTNAKITLQAGGIFIEKNGKPSISIYQQDDSDKYDMTISGDILSDGNVHLSGDIWLDGDVWLKESANTYSSLRSRFET